MNRPFIKTGYLGLAVIAMSVLLLFVFPSKTPSLPDGFFTPIIAFEFARTHADIMGMFGGTDLTVRKEMVSAMDLGNKLDYIYMCLYSIFLILFCLRCAKVSKNDFFYSGICLSLMVLAGDAMENVQLLCITSHLESGDFTAQLHLLHVFTWVKWGGLAVIFLLLSPWFLKGDKFSKITGITGIASFILAIAAFMHRSMINEFFSLSVAVMFVLMIIFCFTFKSGDHV